MRGSDNNEHNKDSKTYIVVLPINATLKLEPNLPPVLGVGVSCVLSQREL